MFFALTLHSLPIIFPDLLDFFICVLLSLPIVKVKKQPFTSHLRMGTRPGLGIRPLGRRDRAGPTRLVLHAWWGTRF